MQACLMLNDDGGLQIENCRLVWLGGDAQRACCVGARNAQRFWGPLQAGKVLRSEAPCATRALRIDGGQAAGS